MVADTPEVEAVYLRESTKIEPLCCRWYAWAHVVAPLQQALNVAFRQLPLLKSFIASPSVHEAASKDPRMMGGGFMNLKASDVGAVRALMREMKERCARLIKFAEDLVNFDRQVQASATGQCLDHLYESLPQSLAGLIEITYDLNSHPTLRLLEEFLYDDELSTQATHELCFFQSKDEDRSFFLNTPRLDSPDRFMMRIPFSDPRLDLLARARIEPVCFAELVRELAVSSERTERFRQYFTGVPPIRRAPDYRGDDVRIRYFGHACVLIQTDQVSILIDPLFAWENDAERRRLIFNDLPDFIDYVFLTHNHHDHFSPEVFLQLRNRIGQILVPRNNPNTVADASMRLVLNHIGFSNVRVMDPLDTVAFSGGFLASLPFYGEHAGLSITSKHGMYLDIKGRKLAFLADSNCLDRIVYRRVADRFGKADVLFIGMECQGAPLSWIYGPYLTNQISRKDDESRRSNGSDAEHAWALREELGSKRVFVYAMGQEPWFRYHLDLIYTPESKQIVESEKFLHRCAQARIPAVRLNGCTEFEL